MTEPNLIKRNEELEAWKKESMEVMSNLNLQEVGKVLNLKLGTDISKQILPSIQLLIKRNKELEAMLENTLQLNKEVLLQMKDVGVESEIVEFYLPTNISEITELLNKK